jgi:hypothetical protein
MDACTVEAELVFVGLHPEVIVDRGEDGNNEPAFAEADPGVEGLAEAFFFLLGDVSAVNGLRFGKRGEGLVGHGVYVFELPEQLSMDLKRPDKCPAKPKRQTVNKLNYRLN